jgi:hypothetical protein
MKKRGERKMMALHGSGAILLSGSQYNSDSEIEVMKMIFLLSIGERD